MNAKPLPALLMPAPAALPLAAPTASAACGSRSVNGPNVRPYCCEPSVVAFLCTTHAQADPHALAVNAWFDGYEAHSIIPLGIA